MDPLPHYFNRSNLSFAFLLTMLIECICERLNLWSRCQYFVLAPYAFGPLSFMIGKMPAPK